MLYASIYDAPFGPVTVFSNGTSITGVYTEQMKLTCPIFADDAIMKAFAWLDKYFEGNAPDIRSLPLRASGTIFQQDVWKRLYEIPFGSTVTYGQLAVEIATERGITRMSSQAVGQAVGANPISIIIPCHRVIGVNGNLVGYAGGLQIKKWLLEHEATYNKHP